MINSVLSVYPNSIRAHTCLCLTYASFGKLDDAHKEADLIYNLSDYPMEREFTYLYLIGMILLEEGKLSEALDSLKSGLRKYRKSAQTTSLRISLEEEIITAIAETYLRQNNYQAASEEYNKMIDMPLGWGRNDEHMWARKHYKLGIIYEKTQDHKNAMNEFETFLKLWDGADDNIPAIRDAKERLAALKKES